MKELHEKQTPSKQAKLRVLLLTPVNAQENIFKTSKTKREKIIKQKGYGIQLQNKQN